MNCYLLLSDEELSDQLTAALAPILPYLGTVLPKAVPVEAFCLIEEYKRRHSKLLPSK